MLFKAKKQARGPLAASNQLKKNADKMSNKMTEPERIFDNLMSEIGVLSESQKVVGKKIFDFYIPSKNMLIEIHGDYWHANPIIYENKELNRIQKKNVKNDLFKTSLAITNGYLIETVWEYDLHNNYSVIKNKLINLLK